MTYSAEVLADSPLAYYRLGEASGTTMTDSSGNGRNGSHVSSPTLGSTSLLVGDANTAVTYSSGKYSETTSATWMDASSFSVDALIKPTAVSGTQTIASRYDGGDSGSFTVSSWTLRLDGNKLACYIFSGASFGVATQSTTLTAGTTYHVGATYDGTTGAITVYVNGTSVGTGTRTSMNSPVTRPFRISRSGNSATESFAGVIDEVAYYGSVLTGTRMAAHYTAATTSGVTVALDRFTSAATFLDVVPSSSIAVDLDRFASAATLLDVSPTTSIPTDTTNLLTGLNVGMFGEVILDRPDETPPPAPPRRDIAIPYPQPVMVNGRPT